MDHMEVIYLRYNSFQTTYGHWMSSIHFLFPLILTAILIWGMSTFHFLISCQKYHFYPTLQCLHPSIDLFNIHKA